MATLLQCKLCSATNNLISLFSGKCVENRNYIRKLVAVTTGIRFTENGMFNYICFTCVVQIYNFHIFKIRAAENEGRLQSINSNSVRRTLKYEIQSMDNIKLPNLAELKNTLGNWLLTKKQTLKDYSEQEESDYEESLDIPIEKRAKEDCYNKTSFTQTIIDTVNVETQCDVTKNTTNSRTQTDNLSKCNVKIQCDLKNILKIESCTQTEFQILNNINTTNFSSQTDSILKCNVKIQCDLKNGGYSEIESKTANSIATQTEVGTNNKCTKTSVTSKIQKNCSMVDITKNKGNCRANKSQITNNLKSNQLSYVQNIYINQKLIDSPSTKNEATTISLNNKKEISNLVSRRSLQHPSSKTNMTKSGNKDMIPSISENMKCSKILTEETFALQHSPLDISPIKEELKSPTPSPCSPLLASLEIITEEEKEEAKTSSPDNIQVSLSSCNLLAIKKRVQHVQICKYCDHTLYSKSELKLHKRIHLTCSFCKKTFSNVKKTGIHMDFECHQKVASLPVISIVRIEDSKEIRETLPQLCLKLKEMANTKNIAKRNAAPVNFCTKKAKLK